MAYAKTRRIYCKREAEVWSCDPKRFAVNAYLKASNIFNFLRQLVLFGVSANGGPFFVYSVERFRRVIVSTSQLIFKTKFSSVKMRFCPRLPVHRSRHKERNNTLQ